MSDEGQPAGTTTTRAEAILEFLEGAGIPYKLIEHEPTMSATAEAQATHCPPVQVAKSVVLHDGAEYVIAAVPTARRLDLHKLRELLGVTRQLRLATEDEIPGSSPSWRSVRCGRSGRWSRRRR